MYAEVHSLLSTLTLLFMQTRQVGVDTFMEACIENFSKNPMVLEYVRFDAAPPLSAVSIDIRDVLMTDFTSDVPLGSYIDQLQASLPFFAWFLSAPLEWDVSACMRHRYLRHGQEQCLMSRQALQLANLTHTRCYCMYNLLLMCLGSPL